MYSIASSIENRLLRLGMALLAALAIAVCAGCSGRSIQADNPVLGATPPRMPASLARQDSTQPKQLASAEGGIEQASFASDPDIAFDEDMTGIAATVNGMPILVTDVLERFTPQLKAAQEQLPDAEFAKLKRKLIEQELPMHIEQAILVDSALSQLKTEQREMVEQQLDTYFAEYLKQIQAEMGASSLAEMEGMLQQAGTSITNLQRAFNSRQLADQTMSMLADKEPLVNRAELLAEYEKRIEEFTEPQQVRWQQIWISYQRHGGKKQALAVVDQAVEALKRGASFDDVARQFSDGVMAADGGRWNEWIARGHLANEQIDRMLFELKVGEIGHVVEGEKAFQIVRVTERKPQSIKTFAEVQDQLGQEIKLRKRRKMVEEIVAGLKKDAIITTMFDGQE